MSKEKKSIECVMLSMYDKGSDRYGSWEVMHHIMNPGWFSIYREDLKKYTRHTVRIPLTNADYGYEIGSERPEKSDEVVITWFWDKKTPFNFKHFDKNLLKLDKFCNENAGLLYNEYDFEWLQHLEKGRENETYHV